MLVVFEEYASDYAVTIVSRWSQRVATSTSSRSMPVALYALAAGAFGIGTTEFVIMGLLMQVAADLKVSIATAGLLISGYALGVFVGAPVLTVATSRMPRKTVLIGLMAIFTIGNLCCALAPNYTVLLLARVITALAHGTFFGVGAVVATGLVAPDRRASAISIMFTGLTIATLLGVPAGAWLGLHFGWRSTFWAVAAIGIVAMLVNIALVPASRDNSGGTVANAATPSKPTKSTAHTLLCSANVITLSTAISTTSVSNSAGINLRSASLPPNRFPAMRPTPKINKIGDTALLLKPVTSVRIGWI